MRTIWKTPIDRIGAASDIGFAVSVPQGSKPLTLMVQDGRPCLWWEVDDQEPRADQRIIYLIGTGHEMHGNARVYLGSVIEGAFVWHFYTDR